MPPAVIQFGRNVVHDRDLVAGESAVTSAPTGFRGLLAADGGLGLRGDAANFRVNCRREYLWKVWVGENCKVLSAIDRSPVKVGRLVVSPSAVLQARAQGAKFYCA